MSISHQSWLKTDFRVTMKLSVGSWMVGQLPVPYDGVCLGLWLIWNETDEIVNIAVRIMVVNVRWD